MKRFVSWMLILVMLISVLPPVGVTAHAEETEPTEVTQSVVETEVAEPSVPEDTEETEITAEPEAEKQEETPWKGRSAVFVGDSITAGVGTTKLYYQFLDEELEFSSVTAMGVSGSCISAASDYGQKNQPLINRYQNIPSADLIVIFMGTNDYGHETPLGSASDTQDGTFYGALNTVIPALAAKHTSSKIVFVTSLHRYGHGTSKILGTKFTDDSIPNGVGASLEDYMNAMKEVCAQNGVSVIDLHTECTLDPSDAAVRAEYMPDGIHPNAAGHEVIAGIMESHIRTFEPVEGEPAVLTEMIQGNKFASGNNQPCRASSRINYYLKAGTVITLKNPDVMQWACARTSNEFSSDNLGYFPESQWTDIATAVVAEDGWIGFTFKYRDETQSFNLSKPLSDYITIHTHSYGTAVTAPTCTEQGYTTYTCACGDSYVDDFVDAAGEHAYKNGICTGCGVNETIVPSPDIDLFVFAGQSNMMGASILEPKVNVFTEKAWEYKYMPKLRGAKTGAFVSVKNPAGEWHYIDLEAAYGDHLNDLTYKATVKDYSSNTYFCPAMRNGIKGFSAQSEADTYPAASLAPYFVTEYAEYGHSSVYAHMAKGAVKIVHYFNEEMMNRYNALISEYNTNNGKSYSVLTPADLSGAGDAFDDKYNAMLEDYASIVLDGTVKNNCFVWLQGEGDGGRSYIEYKLKMQVLWEHLQSLGFTHFFVLRVGFWGNTGVLNVIKAQEDFCAENENCYIVTRAPSLIPHPSATTENWWISEPSSEYDNCRDSYLIESSNHHFNEKAMQIFAERSAQNVHRILHQGLDPILEEENIQGMQQEQEENPDMNLPEDTTPCTSYLGTDTFCNSLSVSQQSNIWKETASSSAASTNLIPVTSADSVWIQYVFFLSEAHAVGGFYDKEGNLVAPLYYKDFGFSLGGGGGESAFRTPETTNRISVAAIEAATGKEIAFVRFTAWQASAGGHTNTEARIYHTYTPVVTGPTCTEQGYTTYTCACGDSYVDSYVEATGHHYENGICAACGVYISEPAWERGTIASVTGANDSINSRMRTVGYVKLTDFAGVGIHTGFTMTNFVYDENHVYLGTSSWLGDGIPFTTAELQEKYPSGVYFRVVFRALDQRNLTDADIEASGVKFYLPGEEIPVPDFGFDYENVGNIGVWQDGAIWDGKLFALGAAGTGAVFDVKTGAKLGNLTLDEKDVLKPHANSVCFGNTYYAQGDPYPLLYVNIYNNYASEEDRMEGTCCVYRITESEKGFETELVQVIKIGFVEDLTLWKSKENNGDVRPYGNFVVDTDNNKLYAYVMRDANKTTRFFGFDIPGLNEGTFDERYGCNVVTLESSDIRTQFDCACHYYLQGSCYSSGMILYMGDFGGDAPLCIVDLESQTITDVVCLGHAGLRAEPEVLCADPADGTLYYAAADGMLRKIALKDTHLHAYQTITTAPTCTEQGYTTHTCTTCGDSYVGGYVTAVGHTYANSFCTVCGTQKNTTVKPLDEGICTTATPENYLTISNPATEKLACAPGLVTYGDGKMAVAYLADDVNSVETESSTTIVCRLGLFNLDSPQNGTFLDIAAAGQTIGDVTIGQKAPYEPNLLVLEDGKLLVLFNIRDTSGRYSYYSATVDPASKTVTDYTPLTLDGKTWTPANIAASYNAIADNAISNSGPAGSMVFTSQIVSHGGYYYGYCGGICSGFGGILVRSTDGIHWTSVLTPEALPEMAGVIECGFQFLGDYVYFCMRDISSGVYHCSYNFTTGEQLAKTQKLPDLTTSKPTAFTQDGKLYLIVNKATGDDATIGRRNTALFYEVDPADCRLSLVRQIFCADGCAYHSVANVNGVNYWAFHTDARRINPYTQGRSNLAFLVVPTLHSHAYESVVTAPTCTEQGYTTHICSDCGASYVDAYVGALGHRYESNICVGCGKEKSGILNLGDYSSMYASGCITVAANMWQVGVVNYHYQIPLADFKDYNQVTVTANSTNKSYIAFFTKRMTEAGAIDYADGWTEVLIMAPGTTQTLPVPADAQYMYILNNNAAGDSLLPESVVFSCGHTYENGKCTICGAEEIHVHGYESTITAPTCTEQGYTTHTCTVCGDSYVDSYVAAKGHTEVIDKAIAATCTTAGKTEGKHCSVCSAVIVAQKEVPAKGHTEVTDKAVSATCTTAGKTEGKHCSTCGTVLVAQKEIPAPGHSYGAWTVTTNPTCTEKGQERRDCANCDAYETRDVAAKGHTEVTDKAVSATCTTAGKTEGKHCSVCGTVLVTQNTIPAKGHTWDAGKVTKEPTEQTEGVKTFTCTACGETKTEAIPVLGHTHKYTAKVIAPTCTEQGYTTYTCTCGDSYVDNYVQANGHSYGAWTVISKPTCTVQGTEQRECHCGQTETRTIAAKGHTEVTDKAVAATCTTAGKTEGKHCSVCNAVLVAQKEVPAKGHAWDNGKVTKEPTEQTEGMKTYTCTACGETKTETIPTLDHTHKYTSEVTAPTCTAQGYTTYTCTCGDCYVDNYVQANGHSYGAWAVTIKPTCTEKGTERRDCNNCDYSETREVAAKGHTEVIDKAVAATCTATGLTEGKHCSVCNTVLVAQTKIAALGHNWDVGVVTKEPTETEEGESVFTCQTCGKTKIQKLPTLSHVHKYTAVMTEPTCTEQGYTTYTCSCGDSYVDDYVEATGHKAGQWQSDEKDHWRVCALCSAILDKSVHSGTSCTICGHETPEQSHGYELGDVNHDGKINAKDATLILQKSVGVLKETAKFCEDCAEVSGDGKLNAKDSTLILQFSVGLRDSFPAQEN